MNWFLLSRTGWTKLFLGQMLQELPMQDGSFQCTHTITTVSTRSQPSVLLDINSGEVMWMNCVKDLCKILDSVSLDLTYFHTFWLDFLLPRWVSIHCFLQTFVSFNCCVFYRHSMTPTNCMMKMEFQSRIQPPCGNILSTLALGWPVPCML